MENKKTINLLLTIGLYSLLIYVVYWGTLLAFFSLWDFFKNIRLGANFIQVVYGLIGLVGLLNFWHYHKKLKKYTAWQMWRTFYNREKKKIYFTIAITVVYVIVFKLVQKGLNLPPFAQGLFHILTLPWTFGDGVVFLVSLNVRRYFSFLTFFNQTGWLLSLMLEIYFIFFISRIVFWRPKLKTATKT